MTLKHLEEQIWKIEGFRVRFSRNGRNVRSDREDMPSYPYHRAAKRSWTIDRYRRCRLQAAYPGFEFDIVEGSGERAPGNTHLSTLRGSYRA
jgi:hypothetical protein